MSTAWIAGDDPGGDGAHGVAVCALRLAGDRWRAEGLQVTSSRCVAEAVAWVEAHTPDAPLLAVGVDTLTEWNGGSAGWRPADRWLRRAYPGVKNSVAAPNSLFGSMPVGGMAFLTRMVLGLGYSVAPGPYWQFQGKLIRDIYNETYPVQG